MEPPRSAFALEAVMTAWLCQVWRRLLQVVDLLVLARIPILMVAAGFLLAGYVPQIRELFDISLGGDGSGWWAPSAFVFSAGLGLLVWFSARTLYAFDWPRRVSDPRLQELAGALLPRLLGAAVPLIMAAAYLQATPPARDGANIVWCLAYLALTAALLIVTSLRRRLARWLLPHLGRPAGQVAAEPPVALLKHWGQLGFWTRMAHYAGILALVLSWIVGSRFPGWIDQFGPLALILGAAAFTVWASTYFVYLAARARFPLITALALWAVLMTWLGGNDNHAVRLSASMNSDQDPPSGLHYGGDGREPLVTFMDAWWDDARRRDCEDRVWFVSSEGGGIRAAMWTVLVLAELERDSGGRLWRCTLAVSGVSGGSLGLAAFAAQLRDRDGALDRDALVAMMEADFLAPVLGSMFGTDGVQRFIPFRLFTDRGQALERSWLNAYAEGIPGNSFQGPLADIAYARADRRRITAPFLNTTIVDSGLRLLQHPFSSLGPITEYPGAVDGADWLPREHPLFSAALNSARFTFVSPAGSVRMRDADGKPKVLGQVVDGGYFENSGTTTIEALVRQFHAAAAAQVPVRVIHISNDPAVPPFSPQGNDVCPDPLPPPDPMPVFGEARAPAIALLATRDARATYARQALADRIRALPGAKLWHYRLCRGHRDIPLGWTIGAMTTAEMERQLRGDGHDLAANALQTTREILAEFGPTLP
jgi:hypothetical protein